MCNMLGARIRDLEAREGKLEGPEEFKEDFLEEVAGKPSPGG